MALMIFATLWLKCTWCTYYKGMITNFLVIGFNFCVGNKIQDMYKIADNKTI